MMRKRTCASCSGKGYRVGFRGADAEILKNCRPCAECKGAGELWVYEGKTTGIPLNEFAATRPRPAFLLKQ